MNLRKEREKWCSKWLHKRLTGRAITELFKQDRELREKLKEELVCSFCKETPKYGMMCSACNNAGIKIDKIMGVKE